MFLMLLQVYKTMKNVGGRGHKARYLTKVKRIPIQLESQISKMIELMESQDTRDMELAFEYMPSLNVAMLHCRNILKSKKSAKESMERLLRLFYNTDYIRL